MVALAGCHATTSNAVAPPAGYHFPALSRRVVDAAHILPPADVVRMERWSQMLDRKTGHQLVVVTVTSLEGHDIADYARQLGTYWGIGRKGYYDGVILLIAPNEHKVRIAVGDGLRREMTDEQAQHILNADVLPSCRDGDIATGVLMGASDLTWDLLGSQQEKTWF